MSLKIVLQAIPILLLVLLAIAIIIPACTPYPDTKKRVDEYKSALTSQQAAPGDQAEGLAAFTTFLQKIGDKTYVEENTAKVYAPDAYLNDTLVTHTGPDEIKAYFLETADTMATYEVTIDDTFLSGTDHYIRWTMVFSAPKLNKGNPVHSVGISQIRFNDSGQVTMHQDFWDSGMNIYGQIPVVGGMIETIRRRFE
ncbi:MAG: nuclear transport factor 2 family protein [Luteolibacter sp.]